MSAIGSKRTCVGALHMSAFGGKADIPFCAANVVRRELLATARKVLCF